MRRFNRILATALAFLLAVTVFPATQADAQASGNFVIADFTQGTENWTGGNMTLNTDVKWNDSGYTALLETHYDETQETEGLKYSPYYGEKSFADTDIPSDWSQVEYINMLVYCPKAYPNSINSMMFFSDSTSSYYRVYFPYDFEGWKIVSFKKSDIGARDTKADWSKISRIMVSTYGWGGTAVPDAKLYYGKIWATDAPITATLVSESHPDGTEGVTAQDNVVSFTVSDKLLAGSTGTVEVSVAAPDGPYTAVEQSEYTLEYEDNTVKVVFANDLLRRKKYRIAISDVFTVSEKIFSHETTFTTEGYKSNFEDNTLFTVADFTQTGEADLWVKGNKDWAISCLTAQSAPAQSGYDGTLGNLKTHYTSAEVSSETDRYIPYSVQKAMSAAAGIKNDWSEADYLNLLVYAPAKVDNSRFTLNALTSSGSGNSYFHYIVDTAFEGWKIIRMPLDSFAKRDTNANWGNVYALQIGMAAWQVGYPEADELVDIYMKEMWLSKDNGKGKVTGMSIKDGERDVPINNTEFTLEYNELLCDAPYAVSVQLYQYENTGYVLCASPTASMSKQTLTVDFGDILKPNTSYKLEIDNLYLKDGEEVSQSVKFMTGDAQVYASKPVISEDVVTGNVTVSTNAYNKMSEAVQVILAAAIYDDEGNFITERHESFHVAAQSTTDKTLNLGDVSAILYDAGAEDIFAYSIEAYVVDASNNYAPLTRHTVCYPDATLKYTDTALAEGTVSCDAVVRDTKVEVSGAVTKGGIRPVVVSILDKQGAPVTMMQTQTNAEGAYSVTIDISGISVQSGWYPVKASALYASGDSQASEQIYCATDSEKEALVSDINATVSKTEVEELLDVEKNQAILGIGSEDCGGIAEVLFEQKPYDDFSETAAMISTAERLLAQLNASDWTELAEFLADNDDIICGDEFDESFFAKSQSVRNAICAKLPEKTDYTAFSQFREALEDAITAYNKSKDNGRGKTGSSSGSGGGGSLVGTKVLPAEPVAPVADGSTTPVAMPFSDLGGYTWAEEAIGALYESGIVAGGGDGTFRPGDTVKREEFVKMLVEALGLSAAGESGFADSTAGAWYEKYLAAAKENGLVQGKTDGSFGVGDTISRQDMAVMLARALETAGYSAAAAQTAEFSDATEIAEYAREAVTKMQQYGLINGMGDGRFAPLESANRAQAAVMIYRMLDASGKGDR